ncbi:MAG: hypothetical protein IKZ62_05605 [Prevotella sp.]|nr:hypothetical protein [Prevotella sp.]
MTNNENTIKKWMKGIPYELAFWNNVYRWKRTFNGMMNWSHYGKEIELELFNASLFLSSQPSPKIIDLGCGMSYATGNMITRNGTLEPIDIHYIDPLATNFNQILKRYHRQLPMIEFGMMEYISAFYPNHDTDLIIIQNALDHSAEPVKGILEAIDALRINGILYLNHHPNEAEKEQYKGFHQYNITIEKDHLIIWNKENHWDINNMLGTFASIKTCQHDNGHIIAVITKKEDVPTNMLTEKADIRNLSGVLINLSQQHIGRAICQKTNYWFYNIIQFFVQSLSWDTKMELKRIIKQA